MSAAKHTPGPWTFLSSLSRMGVIAWKRISISADNEHVAVLEICLHPAEDNAIQQEKMEANARLIAAAPDLLEALTDMLKHGFMGDRDRAVLAIKKATGEAK